MNMEIQEGDRKYKKYQTKVINGLKNTVEGFNSRVDEVEEKSVSWKTKQWNSPRQSNKVKKELKEVKIPLQSCMTTSSNILFTL